MTKGRQLYFYFVWIRSQFFFFLFFFFVLFQWILFANCFPAYRNWMNSVGVNPFVYNLYSDLTDGLILIQLFDIVRAGIVNWNKVIKHFNKMKCNFEKLCKYKSCFLLTETLGDLGCQHTRRIKRDESLNISLVYNKMKCPSCIVYGQSIFGLQLCFLLVNFKVYVKSWYAIKERNQSKFD